MGSNRVVAYVNKPIEIINYPTYWYNFISIVGYMIEKNDELPNLHTEWSPAALLKRENDQNTPYHKRFYHNLQILSPAYRRFIKEIVESHVGEPVVFQKVPTFRIQFPGNIAVGEKHKDSDYNHLSNAINFWVPLTDVNKHNCIWTADGPITCKYGQAVVFDGANIEHWNVPNKSKKTRVSFDFRVVPKSKFKPSKKKTINTGMQMDIGGYYDTL